MMAMVPPPIRARVRENIWEQGTGTAQLLQIHLEGLARRFQFEYCIVNMPEVKDRFNIEGYGLFSVLSEAELRHLEGLQLPKHKIQWISGRYAVKSALFKRKSKAGQFMDVRGVDVLKGPDSAPYLPQYPSLQVSITHSYPYCIGVVAETRIGIDLESVFNPPDSLFQYFYSPKEREELQVLGESETRSARSIVFWTRKEAVSKLLRQGMKLDFKALDTTRDEISLTGDPCGIIQLASGVCKDFCISTAVLAPNDPNH